MSMMKSELTCMCIGSITSQSVRHCRDKTKSPRPELMVIADALCGWSCFNDSVTVFTDTILIVHAYVTDTIFIEHRADTTMCFITQPAFHQRDKLDYIKTA